MLKTLKSNDNPFPSTSSIRKLSDQLFDMDYDIINARPNRSLGLQHPFYKLVKRVWIRWIGSGRPLYLGIYNSKL